MEIEPLGDSALIVRVVDEFETDPEASLNTVLRVFRCLEAAAIPGVIELAPAYRTVAVFYDPARIARTELTPSPFESLTAEIESALQNQSAGRGEGAPPRTVEIPVCYDLEFALDLAQVAAYAGMSELEVVRRHSSARYRVNCVGFTPGFPYLTGLPAELATPRRATPRTEIPAGSVAIGGAQTGIYPTKSPGGWNVIGRTPLRLFDHQREPPAILRAGDRITLRQISREEFDSLRQ
ncbi:MAG: inhibitor of KinA [Verrucomicrobiota bacterium]